MHAKCFLLHRRKLLDGSVNLTQYGFAANHEHGHYVAEKRVVRRVQQCFEKLWERSSEVTSEMVNAVVLNRAARVEKAKQEAHITSDERAQESDRKAQSDARVKQERYASREAQSRGRERARSEPPSPPKDMDQASSSLARESKPSGRRARRPGQNLRDQRASERQEQFQATLESSVTRPLMNDQKEAVHGCQGEAVPSIRTECHEPSQDEASRKTATLMYTVSRSANKSKSSVAELREEQ